MNSDHRPQITVGYSDLLEPRERHCPWAGCCQSLAYVLMSVLALYCLYIVVGLLQVHLGFVFCEVNYGAL